MIARVEAAVRRLRRAGALRALCLVAALAGVGLGGCSEDAADPDSQRAAPDLSEAIEKVTELGPVKATVRVAPEKPEIGDPITLELEVVADPGVSVEMPPFGEALGRFQVSQFVPRQTTRDGASVMTQTYTLQAPMSGRQRIPPLRIEFIDRRGGSASGQTGNAPASDSTAGNLADDPDRPREILTDEISLMIASVLPDGAVANELGEPAGALEVSGPWWRSPWTWLAMVLVLGIGIGGAIGVRSWLRAARLRSRETAYDKAMGRLAKLEGRGLPTQGEADSWYVELSAIIRRYLEDRYMLRAPELTTEEFLSIARRSGQISSSHRELLTAFLMGCDRVKFARHEPDEAESKQSLEAARQFLRETRLIPIGQRPDNAPRVESARRSAADEVGKPAEPDERADDVARVAEVATKLADDARAESVADAESETEQDTDEEKNA